MAQGLAAAVRRERFCRGRAVGDLGPFQIEIGQLRQPGQLRQFCSADAAALQAEPFELRKWLELRETRFRNLPDGFTLRPGMRVVADIKVGRRAILDYVVNPITRVIDESLREP